MIINGDSLIELKKLADDSVDLVCTDPPYGYSFMGKDWDKAVPSVELWQECLRVLKPGAFAFVMSAPRSDVQSQMVVRLAEAGFRLDFTPIYWTYASGFPKAGNVSKLVDKRKGTTPDESREFASYIKARRIELGITLSRADQEVCGGTTNYSWFEGRTAGQRLPKQTEYLRIKRLLQLDDRYDEFIGEAEREVVGKSKNKSGIGNSVKGHYTVGGTVAMHTDITAPATPQAKALDGSYTGFQPKPAVEVIIVAMKPLSEKTYVDQALKNGKGITWLDDCRVPTGENLASNGTTKKFVGSNNNRADEGERIPYENNPQGRFPANLLVSDDVLNDGEVTHSRVANRKPRKGNEMWSNGSGGTDKTQPQDSGSYSRYFDLDKWASTLPFLIVPKASKSEKNKGLDGFEDRLTAGLPMRSKDGDKAGLGGDGTKTDRVVTMKNHHPTVKPLKLMSYLITLGSRPGDVVLDPFVGSGTTVVAAKQLGRNGVGIERETEYAEIAIARLGATKTPEQQEQDDPQTRLV